SKPRICEVGTFLQHGQQWYSQGHLGSARISPQNAVFGGRRIHSLVPLARLPDRLLPGIRCHAFAQLRTRTGFQTQFRRSQGFGRGLESEPCRSELAAHSFARLAQRPAPRLLLLRPKRTHLRTIARRADPLVPTSRPAGRLSRRLGFLSQEWRLFAGAERTRKIHGGASALPRAGSTASRRRRPDTLQRLREAHAPPLPPINKSIYYQGILPLRKR